MTKAQFLRCAYIAARIGGVSIWVWCDRRGVIATGRCPMTIAG